MASVRTALAAASIAGLGLALAFGPGAVELLQATQQADALQRAADLSRTPAPTSPSATPTAPTVPTRTSTGSRTGAGTATSQGGTTSTRRTPTAYPTMALPGGTPGAPTPPTHEDGKPVLYLTIDDGPDPTWTPQILALLAQQQASATFFVVGEEAARYPAVLRSVRDAGHVVANHTYTHPWLTRLTTPGVRSEITRTDAVIGPVRCLRPPGGFIDATVGAVARSTCKLVQLWDIDTRDWALPGAGAISGSIMRGLRPGAVVLVHDGGGPRAQTVAALKSALPQITAKGYVVRALPACR